MSFLQEVVQLSLAFTTVYHLGLDEVELRFSRLHDNMKTAFLDAIASSSCYPCESVSESVSE